MINVLNNAFKNAWTGGAQMYEAAKESRYYSIVDNLNFDQDEMLDLADLDTLRSCAREVYSNFAPVAGAIHEKASTAVGQHWIPIHKGADERYGKQATQWLRQYYKICDVRGEPYTFLNNLQTASITLDRDGEFFVMPIVTANGWPMIQFLEGHRVGSRYGMEYKDRFNGAEFCNGIWRTDNGRAIAYNVLGRKPTDDRVVMADRIWHFYDPHWFSQGRGVPRIVQGLLDWRDVKRFRENEKTAANIFSSLTIVQKNAQGKADLTKEYFSQDDDGTQPITNEEKKLTIEEYLRGSVRYIRANGNDDIQSFKYDRPPTQVVTFMDAIMRGAFSGMDWPFEQAYDMRGTGTAQVRAITNKCQRSINRRQLLLHNLATKITTFALAVANRRDDIFTTKIPVDWWKWDFATPPKMTADAYRDAAQDREDYKIGFATLSEIYGKRGLWWVDHIDQRFDEELRIDAKVKETGIAMERVRMLTPNGNAVEQTDQDSDDNKADDDDAKTSKQDKDRKAREE
jgi:capsid protein